MKYDPITNMLVKDTSKVKDAKDKQTYIVDFIWNDSGRKDFRTVEASNEHEAYRIFIQGGSMGKPYERNVKITNIKVRDSKAKDARPSNLKKDKYVISLDRAKREMDNMLGNRDQYTVTREGISNFVFKHKITGKTIGLFYDMSGDLYYDPTVMIRD